MSILMKAENESQISTIASRELEELMSSEGLARLDVWRKAKEFALLVYKEALSTLPPEEKWGLGQQIRRSAQSIPANIAEGYGRFYFQETIRFSYITRGSLDETLSHLVLAYELGYLPEIKYRQLISAGDDLAKLINGYIAYLKRTRQGANEPGSPESIREPGETYDSNSTSDVIEYRED
jgi:four helix bundle protein